VTALREALAGYLQIRRRLGFTMPQDGRLLEGFVEFLAQAGAERITTELALRWARLPADAHPHRWRQRLGVARGLARHLAAIDPASEVPSADLLPGASPADRAIHLHRRRHRGAAGRCRAAQAAAARRAASDADRAAGRHRDVLQG
jgi:hypothetical protein